MTEYSWLFLRTNGENNKPSRILNKNKQEASYPYFGPGEYDFRNRSVLANCTRRRRRQITSWICTATNKLAQCCNRCSRAHIVEDEDRYCGLVDTGNH